MVRWNLNHCSQVYDVPVVNRKNVFKTSIRIFINEPNVSYMFSFSISQINGESPSGRCNQKLCCVVGIQPWISAQLRVTLMRQKHGIEKLVDGAIEPSHECLGTVSPSTSTWYFKASVYRSRWWDTVAIKAFTSKTVQEWLTRDRCLQASIIPCSSCPETSKFNSVKITDTKVDSFGVIGLF